MKLHRLLLLLSLCWAEALSAQSTHFSFDSLFARHPDLFDSVINHRQDLRLQILYTRVDRDAQQVPHLTTYSFDADRYYYYCASMAKLPEAVLALEKLNKLAPFRVTMLDSLAIDTISCDDLTFDNMMLHSPYSCIAQYIKEMLLISNNKAFNPLYDFLTQSYFQDRLHELGYTRAVICNRFSGCDTIENRQNNPVKLIDRRSGAVKYAQPGSCNIRRQLYTGDLSPLVGNAVLTGGQVIRQPKDFTFANYLPLSDLHDLLIHIMLPQTQTPEHRLLLTPSDYQYLYKCMGLFPRQSAYPALDSVHYPDHYMKYFMSLDSGTYTMPDHIRIFNKVGQAYGFMTDCSYVTDTLHHIEFFLSCSMYLNADGILNDGKYEYDQIGFPFFHDLFNAIYEQELLRPRRFPPLLHWPDFSDTLLFPVPVRPAWQCFDSTLDISLMEPMLCDMADSMTLSHATARSDSRLSAADIFYRHLSIALRSPGSISYPFERLRQHGITILDAGSGSRRIRIFSFSSAGAPYSSILFQCISDGYITLRTPSDMGFTDATPSALLTALYALQTELDTYFMLITHRTEATGHTESIYACALSGTTVRRPNLFKMDNHLTSDLRIVPPTAHDHLTYDEAHHSLSLPMMERHGHRIHTRRMRLRFDGKVFK